MTNQKPMGMPEEVPAEAVQEMKEAEVPRPFVDRSEPPHPLKKRRAWYRRTYKSSIGPLL
jgi:hypothetical protein